MKHKQISMLVRVVLVVGLAMLYTTPKPALAATITSAQSGNWSLASTWVDGVVPQADDHVVIASDHTVTVDTNTANLASITVNGTLRFDDTGTGRSMTVTGDVTINSGGTLDVATGGSDTTHSLTIGGDLTNDGTFDCWPAASRIINVTFNGSSGTQVSGSTTFYNLTLDNSGATTNFGTSSTTIANTLDAKAGTMSAGTSTITFTGAASSITGTNAKRFYNLVIDSEANITNLSGGSLEIGHDFTNNGTFTSDRTTTFTNDSTSHSLSGSGTTSFGSITIRSSTTVNAGSHNFTLTGSSFTVYGIFNGGTATVTFDGSTTLALGVSGAMNFNSLTINNSKSLTAPSNLNINLAGNFTDNNTSSSGFTHNNGTVTFNGGTTQNLTLNVSTTFNNLTVNSGVILVETVSADNATVSDTLTNSGTIRKSQSVSEAGSKTFGLTGVTLNVTTQGSLSNLQVDRIDSNHANATSYQQTGKHWAITPTGNSFTVDITLPHNNLSDPSACRYTGTGWSCGRTSFTSSTVTRSSVTELSDWAVGDGVPTSVTLSSLTARSPTSQATFFRWQWLALAGAVGLVLGGGAAVRRWLGR